MKKRSNLRRYITKVMQESKESKSKKYVDNFKYCEYNQVISEKLYKFLDLCLKMPFDIQHEKDNYILHINLGDYDDSKNNNNNNNSQIGTISLYGVEDNYITFYITKTNFKMTKNHIDICGYKDPNIYRLFQNKFEDSYKKKSDQTFHKTINEILDTIPQIGREFKIDEILND